MNRIVRYVLGFLIVVFTVGCGKPPTVYADGVIEPVFIRGERWNLVFGGHDEALDIVGAYAITKCSNETIFVHSGLTFENQRDTILHEILHAGTCDTNGNLHNDYYNSSDETTHEGIYKIADFISEVLHANPELAKYLSN